MTTQLTIGVCEDQEPIRKVLVRGLRQARVTRSCVAHDGGRPRLFGADTRST